MLRRYSRDSTTPSEATLERVRDLLRSSFPPEELLDLDDLAETVTAGSRTLWTDAAENAVAVTLPLGTADRDVLLEYLTVDPSRRSRGSGSTFVAEVVAALPGPVVFEIEVPDPAVPDSVRRLVFYRRLGAVRVPFSAAYAMPNLVTGATLPMWLMDLSASGRSPWSPSKVRDLVTAVWVEGYGASSHDPRLAGIVGRVTEDRM